MALGLSGCIYLTQYNIMGVEGVTPFWNFSSHQCLFPSIESLFLADAGEKSKNPLTEIMGKKIESHGKWLSAYQGAST
ncbi:MAG: hypothetical protein F6K21_35935 [Symploca sp. SIO2D2]|nr:hypothetical protein [Symploca sp. SIO2D2]